MNDDNKLPSDEQLTAYIDGELPPDETARIGLLLETDARVAARLEFLSRSSLPFEQAFEPLLAAAPKAKLEAMLASVASAEPSVPVRPTRRGLLAALAACVVAGVVADRAFIGLGRRLAVKDESNEWRAAVAEYIALYTPDTLAGPVPTAQTQAAQLSILEEKLDLRLPAEAISIEGADFKRALVLQYDDAPLAQIAYLDPQTGPMALCIVRSADGAKPAEVEARKGMNVVYWASPSHAFMLIGHASADRMRTVADGIMARLEA